MSHFKDGEYFTANHDYSENDSDEEQAANEIIKERSRWLDANYNVLEDLYHTFLENGRSVFGHDFFCRGRYNAGGFWDFVDFLHIYRQ